MMPRNIEVNVTKPLVCFYMAINIGAMYAPTAATKMTDWMLGKYNLFYESQIPALAHQFLNGTISAENKEALAALQSA